MSFLDLFMSKKTLALIGMGQDAMALAESIAAKDADHTAMSFLALIHDSGTLTGIHELTDDRLAKYQQGMAMVTEALFADVG